MFFCFEGIDGTGKTTVIQEVKQKLLKEGYQVETTFEPGNSFVGKKLRAILLGEGIEEEYSLSSFEQLLLFIADRSIHIRTVVQPLLADGKIVLSDRGFLSTVVYQGLKGNIPFIDKYALVNTLNTYAVGEVGYPKLILLDVSADIGMYRSKKRGELNKMDSTKLEDAERLRGLYLSEAKKRDAYVIDAGASIESISLVASNYVLSQLK